MFKERDIKITKVRKYPNRCDGDRHVYEYSTEHSYNKPEGRWPGMPEGHTCICGEKVYIVDEGDFFTIPEESMLAKIEHKINPWDF